MKQEKTNAMRKLDQKKLPYNVHSYEGGALSGTEVARALGQDVNCVFKTLVTVGKSGAHYVFMVPVAQELELKKAAAAVGEKSLAMLPQKELLPLTGYVHGGCSPIGMKKQFPTVIDATAADCEAIFFSAGRIGLQIETSPQSLASVVPLRCCDITAEAF
ncbi:MAG: Cys-tRNA(Pro) deacylase [Oscillospiraceae bacterium]|nr:Cys-tRNA(Pro) deacylase [Oscillospiraceae bacterium]